MEFSAHNVTVPSGEKIAIVTPINLYITPAFNGGDDYINNGLQAGSPFATLKRALEWLKDKYISESGFVTINFSAGIHDFNEQIVIDHPEGERIALVGAEPETLVLKYVDSYSTTGFTATNLSPYYSTTKHSITMKCVRPDDTNGYVEIDEVSNPVRGAYAGCGVIVEDYELVYDDSYSPVSFYSAYPTGYNGRNNIQKIAGILGCHKLIEITGGGSISTVESYIRDDWMSLPQGNVRGWWYGNPQNGVTYFGTVTGSCGSASDRSEVQTDAWILATIYPGSSLPRSHFMTSYPVGYYGKPNTSGMLNAGTANVVGITFPLPTLSVGGTAPYTITFPSGPNQEGLFTYAGTAGSIMNDSIAFGSNFHMWSNTPNGGNSSGWRTINSNTITVKILPTVFRRFGNILSITGSGLRKIKNIFFDGKNQYYHYNMISNGASSVDGYSNKMAIHTSTANVGQSVDNEPLGLGLGLCTNVGIANFHTAVFCDNHSRCDLGKIVASNCSFGAYATNGSSIFTVGSV